MAETLGSSLGPIQVSPRRLYKSRSQENAAKAAIQGFQGFSSSSEWIPSCSTIASAPQIRQDSTGDRNETCFCGRSPISFSRAALQPRKGMEWRMQIRDGTHKMCSTGTKPSEGMTQSLAMCERGIAATPPRPSPAQLPSQQCRHGDNLQGSARTLHQQHHHRWHLASTSMWLALLASKKGCAQKTWRSEVPNTTHKLSGRCASFNSTVGGFF